MKATPGLDKLLTTGNHGNSADAALFAIERVADGGGRTDAGAAE